MKSITPILALVPLAAATVIRLEGEARQAFIDALGAAKNVVHHTVEDVARSSDSSSSIHPEDHIDDLQQSSEWGQAIWEFEEEDAESFVSVLNLDLNLDQDQDLDLDLDQNLDWKPPSHEPPCDSSLSALACIKSSNHTRIFSHLLVNYAPSLAADLDAVSTSAADYTILVPFDGGFRRLRKHFRRHGPHHEKPKDGDDDGDDGDDSGDEKEDPDHKKPSHRPMPSNATIERFVRYHVLPGRTSGRELLMASTAETLLDGGDPLGGNPQRIRLSTGPIGPILGGLRVNHMSRIIGHDLQTSNAVLHGLSLPIFPPPPAKLLPALFPTGFSTLSLALLKTGPLSSPSPSSSEHKLVTLFAPNNRAFAKLGIKANAFLFNAPLGIKILRAILKYHAVVGTTVYSDARYGEGADSQEGGKKDIIREELPTLLHGKSLAVARRSFAFMGPRMWVNKVPVAFVDEVARDGVLHVVPKVLFPPCKKHEKDTTTSYTEEEEEEEGEWTVDALVERMTPYLDDFEQHDDVTAEDVDREIEL